MLGAAASAAAQDTPNNSRRSRLIRRYATEARR